MTTPSLCVASGVFCACMASVSSEIVNNPVIQNMGGLSTVSVSSVLGGLLWWTFGQMQKKDRTNKRLTQENHYLRKHLSAAYKELYKQGYTGDSLMPEFDPDPDPEQESK